VAIFRLTDDSVAPALRWATEWSQRDHFHHWVAGVCRRFGIHIADFLNNNPDVEPKHLKIGQRVKIYRRVTDNEER
jgi:hypothetical protein